MPTAAKTLKKHAVIAGRALVSLAHSLERTLEEVRNTASAARVVRSTARKRRRLTPKQLASLRLQGRYMGFVRQLKPKQKAEVRSLKEKRGFEAAIKRARQLAGK